jgi:hypothetical protein
MALRVFSVDARVISNLTVLSRIVIFKQKMITYAQEMFEELFPICIDMAGRARAF